MTPEADRWFDDAAGPVVRPYAMTRGRTSHAAEDRLDLIALVITEEHAGVSEEELGGEHPLAPEHLDILTRCRAEPTSVAELAAGADLPVGVLRVLIGDLMDAGLVRVARPVPPAELVDEQLLRDVISGLRAL
ncbi:DUF742 domain-containing protein [Streptomyces sp. SL13]|uniref:DUF742 domain-containing protein n=1 Tax=Streptantibioticus silvisoli TaxID=2705255 RepID=A0AA90KAG7_9ACTN|nr:DUF742 domain-containing protein [Streptantibioticus silvisoli]MDI5967576.1 DUF742 domain-containing protein [Streptantibioticus silvisoli]MDI5972102.1 DUF742 domain-containing protein [Streptantibioticus silvisoli]